ncbi:helix-turn-helix domain-containing protein [Ktedonobacter racemifer]|uniref:Uncharacterized protein n=1 Tax=Ktedonobacter racemifer DSM 44963 TaxID=485913 RepID=D6U6A1_KTERA|nr:hypothetical protein [Ktedonobacter racemifer]EFH80512.1 hypothetical protein Krac_1121 [Ktedonobacter racemifer DSM 44963]
MEKTFWGAKGEYGPFTPQEDGWPHAGEVIRHYRRTLKMSAEELAKQYGEATNSQVTARWILKMEQQNKVPTDFSRRRILIKILNIPPLLLGLASLESIAYHALTQTQAPSTLAYLSLDMEWYSKEARIFWQLHYAQTAQDALPGLLTYIGNLVPIQQTAHGSLARHLCELLNSYYRLAATIQRDRGDFKQAYAFANESVRLAKEMGDDLYALQVIAASQYTRGVVNLAWGAFGNQVKQGKIVLQKEKLEAAFTDFERALKYASPQLKGIIYSEMARAKGLLSTSPTDVSIALKLIEQAENFIDVDSSDDFHTQILLNGDMKGLDKRRLILGRAKTFLAIRRPAKALDELLDLEMLTEGASHTRRRAWTHILYAQAAFYLEDYATATNEAINAFNACKEVHSTSHLARVNELYSVLIASPYKDNFAVKRLGRLLSTIYLQKG